MPRYFIDTSDQQRFYRDQDGTDYPDLQAARDAAIAALPDMARDQLPDGDQRSFLALVRDEHGATLLVASLSLETTWLADRPGEVIPLHRPQA